MTGGCIALAAYALSALDESETVEFEKHLEDCPHCKTEIPQAADLIRRMYDVEIEGDLWPGPGDAESLSPPTVPLSVIPINRWRKTIVSAGLLAAAAAIAFLIAVPMGLFEPASPGLPPTAAAASVERTFANTGPNIIEVDLAARPEGSAITVTCTIVKGSVTNGVPNQISLWLRTDDGNETLVTTWPSSPAVMTLTATVAVSPDRVSSFEMRDQSGRVLNSLPV